MRLWQLETVLAFKLFVNRKKRCLDSVSNHLILKKWAENFLVSKKLEVKQCLLAFQNIKNVLDFFRVLIHLETGQFDVVRLSFDDFEFFRQNVAVFMLDIHREAKVDRFNDEVIFCSFLDLTTHCSWLTISAFRDKEAHISFVQVFKAKQG